MATKKRYKMTFLKNEQLKSDLYCYLALKVSQSRETPPPKNKGIKSMHLEIFMANKK